MERAMVVEDGEGCLLSLKVVPRSSRNQVVGIEQGELKVKLQAPPIEGAANGALLEFLSKCLKKPKSSLALVTGQQSRHKRIKINGMKASEIERTFHQILTGSKDG